MGRELTSDKDLEVEVTTERDRVDQRAWYRVALVHQQAYRRLAERLSRVGLSVAQFDLLAQLVLASPALLTQSDLARRLLVTKGNISGMLNRMVQQGTVLRVDDPKDKRSNRITITEQGRELFLAGSLIQQELVREMFKTLSTEQVRFLDEIVSSIWEQFEDRQ